MPSNATVDGAFRNTPAEDDWALYASAATSNSAWYVCEMVVSHGAVLEADPVDQTAGLKKLIDHAIGLSDSMSTFLTSLQRAMFEAHFPEALQPERVLQLEDAPRMDELTLPFFLEPPRHRNMP